MIAANSHAAWVPESLTGAARAKAIDAAVAWVRRSRVATRTGLLLFHPDGDDWLPPTITVADFAEETRIASSAFARFPSRDDGQAVLAFVSTYDEFTLAQGAAQASWTSDEIGSVAIVSEGLYGIMGWARAREATNLSDGRTILNSFPASQIEILETMMRGFYDPAKRAGMHRAELAIGQLRLRNDFDPELIEGWAMANQMPAWDLRKLSKLLQSL